VTDEAFNVGLAAVVAQLTRIADALEAAVPPQAEPEPEAPVECQHPEDTRVLFTGMGCVDEWECGVCRARFAVSLVGSHDE
jgi:hypothetical protein